MAGSAALMPRIMVVATRRSEVLARLLTRDDLRYLPSYGSLRK